MVLFLLYDNSFPPIKRLYRFKDDTLYLLVLAFNANVERLQNKFLYPLLTAVHNFL